MTYKKAAQKILGESKKPLHYKEITRKAILKGYIDAQNAATPWITMNAHISTDIRKKGENSLFERVDPGYYALRGTKISYYKTYLNTKQQGDIAENRVAELIMLYGKGLKCYRPVSDDEGIDLIVNLKKKNKIKSVYIQVKSTFGHRQRGFVSSVKESSIWKDENMLFVFVYFDLTEGDIYENLFCIPAPAFLKLTKHSGSNKRRTFSVGLRHPERSKYAEFMIEKRELANKVREFLTTNN